MSFIIITILTNKKYTYIVLWILPHYYIQVFVDRLNKPLILCLFFAMIIMFSLVDNATTTLIYPQVVGNVVDICSILSILLVHRLFRTLLLTFFYYIIINREYRCVCIIIHSPNLCFARHFFVS